MKTLAEVVEHYVKGGVENPQLDEEIFPLKLSDQQKQDLIVFLKGIGPGTSGVSEDQWREEDTHDPRQTAKAPSVPANQLAAVVRGATTPRPGAEGGSSPRAGTAFSGGRSGRRGATR